MDTNTRDITPLAFEPNLTPPIAFLDIEPPEIAVSFGHLSEPVRRCIDRIRELMADEINGAGIQVLCRRPGDRVNIALVVNNQLIAFNFVSEEECERAFERDPNDCSAMDHFVYNWARVARVKLKDNRSISDISHEALSLVARSRAAHSNDRSA